MALLCGKQYEMQMQQDFGAGVYENRFWSPTAFLVSVERVRTRFKLKVTSRNSLKHRTACASSFAVLEHDENTVAGYKLDDYGHVINETWKSLPSTIIALVYGGPERAHLLFPAKIVMMAVSRLWPWGFFL